MNLLRALPALTKLPIAALAALSACAGSLALGRAADGGAAEVSFGVLLLAMGGCALNEWEERDIDARMARTRGRPIPSGRISPRAALAAGLGLAAAGLGVLALSSGWRPAALGLLALVLYVGLYTPLKRATAYAWLPGSLIGAIPPAIGWTAAGGSPLDPGAIALSSFFLLWQVPHFWLLLAARAREYDEAGLPSLARTLGREGLARLTAVWMLAAAASSLLLPLHGVAAAPSAAFGLGAAALAVAFLGARVAGTAGEPAALWAAFRGINLHALAVIALVAADAVA